MLVSNPISVFPRFLTISRKPQLLLVPAVGVDVAASRLSAPSDAHQTAARRFVDHRGLRASKRMHHMA